MIGINNLGSNGRLGNQMFQYASLVGIANNLNYEYTIPNTNDLVNCFLLESCTNSGLVNGDEILLHESHEFCESLFFGCPDNVTLNGYFQSEKYFNNVNEIIKKDFTFKPSIIHSVESSYGDLSDCVSIVVRRYEDYFDYIGCSNNHRNLPIEYYEECMKYFGSNRKYIVCSNNVEWCKTQDIFAKPNITINDITSENKGYFDLCIISNCRDFIVCNSSFSWWGAWLGNDIDKTIIAPVHWYGPGLSHISTKDLIPEKWILVDK